MNRIITAKSAGFCFGVSRSVDMAQRLLEAGGAYSLGQLIHNDDVVRRFEKEGLRVISSPDELPQGARVMIRSHGVSRDIYRQLEDRGAEITDATCPKVKRIHELVSSAHSEGRYVVIIGMHGHPEVEAVKGWCGDCVICENTVELDEWYGKFGELLDKPITMVVQTTQTRSNFTECASFLKKRCTNLQIFDTICGATSMRQEEAAKLAAECDAMVVIGGKHSANSVHLSVICSELCPNVQFIENADELDTDKLRDACTVGITAGASTPAWIIKEVSNKMSEEIKIDAAAAEEKEMSFDEMLEESIKTIYNGDKVTGTVVAITGTEVSVDIGTKYSGFIPTTEFTDDGIKVEDAVKVGDTIEAVVVRVNDVEGTVMLSKSALMQRRAGLWSKRPSKAASFLKAPLLRSTRAA